MTKRAITLRMDEDTYQRLRRVAYDLETTLNGAALQALDQFLPSEIPGDTKTPVSPNRSSRSKNRKKKR